MFTSAGEKTPFLRTPASGCFLQEITCAEVFFQFRMLQNFREHRF